MLPIAVLPAAGILLRLGQDDLLGRIDAPVIGPFFQAMSAAGGALFTNLPLLFAVGVAIGFARKADGSTALAAVVGYLVMQAVFKTMSPIVLEGELDKAGEQAQINYSVFAGIVVGLVTAALFDRYHTIKLPSYLGFFGGRRFVPIVVSLASLVIAFAMSYFYPIFDAGLTSLGQFIGASGAFGAFVYGFANRMLIPVGLHHILNSFVWFIYGDYPTPDGAVVTGELSRFAAGDPTAGILTSGFYPILMFGLPAAAWPWSTSQISGKGSSLSAFCQRRRSPLSSPVSQSRSNSHSCSWLSRCTSSMPCSRDFRSPSHTCSIYTWDSRSPRGSSTSCSTAQLRPRRISPT